MIREREREPAAAAADDEPRINNQIRVPEVRLIDQHGEQVGIVPIHAALQRAFEANLDLVEVADNARPPVCKIMDYSKYKYQKSVRERLARKKQARIEIKEIKLRPATDEHDFQVKMRAARKFLEEGNKVKCTLRYRGREVMHHDLGLAMLRRVEETLEGLAKVEQEPKTLGRQVTMVIAPVASKHG